MYWVYRLIKFTQPIRRSHSHSMKNKVVDKYRFPQSVVGIFAKQPQLGRVKTRLEPQLGAQGALDIHKQLIRYVYLNLEAAGHCPQELWVAHDACGQPLDELFVSLCDPTHIHLQSGSDLGKRMEFTARKVLARAQAVILIGADCPSVDSAYVEQALLSLSGGASVVLGPAQDGGYVLIGLTRIPEGLFAGVDWGSAQVMEQTRQNLRLKGEEWVELTPKWDVDRPEDLSRLGELSPAFPLNGV